MRRGVGGMPHLCDAGVEVQVYEAGHDELVCAVNHLSLAVVLIVLAGCSALADVVDPVISYLQDARVKEGVFGVQREDCSIGYDDSTTHCPLTIQVGGTMSPVLDLRMARRHISILAHIEVYYHRAYDRGECRNSGSPH